MRLPGDGGSTSPTNWADRDYPIPFPDHSSLTHDATSSNFRICVLPVGAIRHGGLGVHPSSTARWACDPNASTCKEGISTCVGVSPLILPFRNRYHWQRHHSDRIQMIIHLMLKFKPCHFLVYSIVRKTCIYTSEGNFLTETR